MLDEVAAAPGMAVPEDGYLTSPIAPGFGMEIPGAWISPRRAKTLKTAKQAPGRTRLRKQVVDERRQ